MAKKIDPTDDQPITVAHIVRCFDRVADQARRQHEQARALALEGGDGIPLGLGLRLIAGDAALLLARMDQTDRRLTWTDHGVLADELGNPAVLHQMDLWGAWGIRVKE